MPKTALGNLPVHLQMQKSKILKLWHVNLHFVLDRRSFCNMEYNLKVFELQGFILTKKKQNSSSCQNVISVVLTGGDTFRGRLFNSGQGTIFPNFRLAEEKTKLDELEASLEEECSIPEISFGFEGKKNIQSVVNERRRSCKRERIDYDLVGSYIKYTILLKAILCHTCLHAVRIRTL